MAAIRQTDMKEIDHKAIYRNGQHYDLLNSKITDEDLPFYLDSTTKYGEPILELACGTGRLTIPIKEKGYSITGIDISEGMICEARKKASEKKVDIKFHLADIRDFDLNCKFKLIILPFNSICHLHDYESIFSCLECVKKHLTDDGRFIVDVFNPSFEHLTRDKDTRTLIGEYFFNSQKVKITETNTYNSSDQINYINWYYDIDGIETTENLNMRMFFPQELDNYLRCSGFKIEKKYGSFDKSEFTSNSDKQIIISKK